MNIFSSSTSLGAILCIVAGCETQPPAPAIPSSGVAPAVQADTTEPKQNALRVVDGLKRTISLAKAPRRIVSLTPRTTEMLFAINAQSQIVGVTTYCNYPPQAKEIEKVGGFSSESLSLERIVSLNPDLILCDGELHLSLIQELERLHMPVIAFSADSLDGLYDEIRLLGRVSGHKDQAARVVESLSGRVGAIRNVAEKLPETERVTVYYQVWGDPMIAAGPACFLGELIRLAGGRNIVEDPSCRFLNLTTEVLLDRNPDVIVSTTDQAELRNVASLRPGWNALKAVQTNRLYLLDGNLVPRLGPRLVDALEQLAHLLYPAHFAAPATAGATSESVGGAHP